MNLQEKPIRRTCCRWSSCARRASLSVPTSAAESCAADSLDSSAFFWSTSSCVGRGVGKGEGVRRVERLGWGALRSGSAGHCATASGFQCFLLVHQLLWLLMGEGCGGGRC
jgi:hypothetical protein